MASQSNDTTVLLLTGYGEMGDMKFLYFSLTLLALLLSVYLNVFLIVLVCLIRSLHKPMFIFLCNLFLNDVYGSFAIYPQILSNFLSYTHFVKRPWCQLQIFCLHSFVCIECSILTVMAFDRYVSICLPLRYQSIMTNSTIYKLISFSWLFPFLMLGVLVGLTSRLPLCDNIIEKLYCDNWSVVRLSCRETSRENLYGIFLTICFPGVPIILIMLSYQKILSVCMKSSKEARGKALNTCLPHIVSVVTFCFNMIFEVITRRLDGKQGLSPIRTFLSLQLLIVPPLLNPLIYGIRLQEMKISIIRVFQKQRVGSEQ